MPALHSKKAPLPTRSAAIAVAGRASEEGAYARSAPSCALELELALDGLEVDEEERLEEEVDDEEEVKEDEGADEVEAVDVDEEPAAPPLVEVVLPLALLAVLLPLLVSVDDVVGTTLMVSIHHNYIQLLLILRNRKAATRNKEGHSR